MTREDFAYGASGVLIIICFSWIASAYLTPVVIAAGMVGALVVVLPVGAAIDKIAEKIVDHFQFLREGS